MFGRRPLFSNITSSFLPRSLHLNRLSSVLSSRIYHFIGSILPLAISRGISISAMADMKEHDNCVEHIDAQDEDPVVVLDTSKKLKEFEKYQRSLTLLEACKEEWKPLIWCKHNPSQPDHFAFVVIIRLELTSRTQACTCSSSASCSDSMD